MTVIRFFVEGYEYAFASIEVDNHKNYYVPRIGETISSFSDDIIVQYPPNHEGNENEKIDFDCFRVMDVTYALGSNNSDEDAENTLIDITVEGDFYDFD